MHQRSENKTQCVAFTQDPHLITQLKQAALSIAGIKLEVIHGNLYTAQNTYRNQTSPALLILDLSQQDDAIEALSALADVCSANTKVLTLGTNKDLSFYQQILNLGVSDYLPLPIDERTLMQRLQQVIAGGSQANRREIHNRKARQLLISGASSGIGCSMICAQLAHILSAQIGLHLAVIDLDIQAGALDLYLGVKSQSGLLELLESPERIDELLLERASIRVADRLQLFKNQSPNFDPHLQLNAVQIQAFQQALAHHYSALLWELPKHLQTHPVSDALYADADDILMVLDSSVTGLRDALRIKQYLQEKNSLGKTHWVVNQNRAARYSKVTAQDLITHAQLEPARVLELPFDIKAAKSTDLGEPLRSGALHKALKQLANQWIGHQITHRSSKSKLKNKTKKWLGAH